jgi:hypothetical protein
MSFEYTHISTVRLFCVAVLIILEEYIIKETFGIVGHLIANYIKTSICLT